MTIVPDPNQASHIKTRNEIFNNDLKRLTDRLMSPQHTFNRVEHSRRQLMSAGSHHHFG